MDHHRHFNRVLTNRLFIPSVALLCLVLISLFYLSTEFNPRAPLIFDNFRPIRESHYPHYDNGLLGVNGTGLHPIQVLIQESEDLWNQKLSRGSRTLGEAVGEYHRRYGRMPPRNFDKWWDYVVTHNVQLPDEYDRIDQDLAHYYIMEPSFLRDSIDQWPHRPDWLHHFLVSSNGTVDYNVPNPSDRAEQQLPLVKEIEHWLPDFTALIYTGDTPDEIASWGYISKALDDIRQGRPLWTSASDFEPDLWGWPSACPPQSPLRTLGPTRLNSPLLNVTKPKSFIWDHSRAMDPCEHPEFTLLNGDLAQHGDGPSVRRPFIPVFALTTTPLHSHVLSASRIGWTEDVGADPPWSEKTIDKLLWRGTPTGCWFNEENEARTNLSQRARLVREAEGKDWMDVAFAGEPGQCEEDYCPRMKELYRFSDRQSLSEANEYRYVMDVDGNGWSARFKRLVTSNALVLKATIYPEWYTDRIQPWVHYVPVQYDYSDLEDIMTFFEGRPATAEKIAQQSKAWSKDFWRHEDLVAYSFRLYLEYGRVVSLDREAATFRWEDVDKK